MAYWPFGSRRGCWECWLLISMSIGSDLLLLFSTGGHWMKGPFFSLGITTAPLDCKPRFLCHVSKPFAEFQCNVVELHLHSTGPAGSFPNLSLFIYNRTPPSVAILQLCERAALITGDYRRKSLAV